MEIHLALLSHFSIKIDGNSLSFAKSFFDQFLFYLLMLLAWSGVGTRKVEADILGGIKRCINNPRPFKVWRGWYNKLVHTTSLHWSASPQPVKLSSGCLATSLLGVAKQRLAPGSDPP